jgi:hypothetical protein
MNEGVGIEFKTLERWGRGRQTRNRLSPAAPSCDPNPHILNHRTIAQHTLASCSPLPLSGDRYRIDEISLLLPRCPVEQ